MSMDFSQRKTSDRKSTMIHIARVINGDKVNMTLEGEFYPNGPDGAKEPSSEFAWTMEDNRGRIHQFENGPRLVVPLDSIDEGQTVRIVAIYKGRRQ